MQVQVQYDSKNSILMNYRVHGNILKTNEKTDLHDGVDKTTIQDCSDSLAINHSRECMT